MRKTILIYLLLSLPAWAAVEPFNNDVWLPLDVFRMGQDLNTFKGLIFNPVTQEKRNLPIGWTVADFVTVSDRQPWLPVVKAIRMHETFSDFVNIHTGELFFGGKNLNIKPIDRFAANGFLAHDRETNRYLWIKPDGKRVQFPAGLTSVSPHSFGEDLWSAYDKEYRPVYVNTHGKLIKPTPVIPQLSHENWKLLRADGFTEGLALAAIGTNISYGPRRFGYLAPDFSWSIPARFEDATAFNKGRAWVMQDGQWGVIDRSGQWVIKPQFNQPSLGDSDEFIVSTRRGDSSGAVFSSRGEFLFELPPGAAAVGYPQLVDDGVIALKVSGGDSRFYDLRTRQWLGTLSYSPQTRAFVDGYAKVEIHGETIEGTNTHAFAEAFIDRNGEIIAFLPRYGPPKKMLPAAEYAKLAPVKGCETLLLPTPLADLKLNDF
jgi:hypothetical protein